MWPIQLKISLDSWIVSSWSLWFYFLRVGVLSRYITNDFFTCWQVSKAKVFNKLLTNRPFPGTRSPENENNGRFKHFWSKFVRISSKIFSKFRKLDVKHLCLRLQSGVAKRHLLATTGLNTNLKNSYLVKTINESRFVE